MVSLKHSSFIDNEILKGPILQAWGCENNSGQSLSHRPAGCKFHFIISFERSHAILTVLQHKQQLTLHHASVRSVSDGVDVRWHFMPLLALVHINNLLRIDGQVLVWVYDDTEETGVCLWDR